jgi:hypothetical protein
VVLSAIDQCILWRGMLVLGVKEVNFLIFLVHDCLTFLYV